MSNTQQVFDFLFKRAKNLLRYPHHTKLQWNQAMDLVKMSRDMAVYLDEEYESDEDEDDEYDDDDEDYESDDDDEEMPDLVSDGESDEEMADAEADAPQDAEMVDLTATTDEEDTASSSTQTPVVVKTETTPDRTSVEGGGC